MESERTFELSVGIGALERVFADASLKRLSKLTLKATQTLEPPSQAGGEARHPVVQEIDDDDEASEGESQRHASSEGCGAADAVLPIQLVVDARSVSRRLKNLLSHLSSVALDARQTAPPAGEENRVESASNAEHLSKLAEKEKEFLLSIYPKDFERFRPSELLTLDDHDRAMRSKEREMTKAAQLERRAAMKEITAKARQEALDAKVAARQAALEARLMEKAAKEEARSREKQAREDERARAIIEKVCSPLAQSWFHP